VQDVDVPALYQFACAFPEAWPRVCSAGVPPLPRFYDALWERCSALFRVDLSRGAETRGEPIGLLGLYDLRLPAGVAWLERLDLSPPSRDALDIATTRFLEDTVQTWPLRRVFVEYYDCIPSPVSGLPGVDTHGRLTEHGYFAGRLWDLVFESVSLLTEPAA
jgi:hypothetical protein